MTLVNSFFTWIMKKRMHQIELFMKYPHEVQEEWLHNLVDTAKNTEWGKTYGYADIKSSNQITRFVSNFGKMWNFLSWVYKIWVYNIWVCRRSPLIHQLWRSRLVILLKLCTWQSIYAITASLPPPSVRRRFPPP